MLRKIAHIILALFLLVSTTGVTFSMHYCGGELVSTSINKVADSCCGDDCGCCEDLTLHFELDDDYVQPAVLVNNTVVELDILFPILFSLQLEWDTTDDEATFSFYDSTPPLNINTRLSLLQTFLC